MKLKGKRTVVFVARTTSQKSGHTLFILAVVRDQIYE